MNARIILRFSHVNAMWQWWLEGSSDLHEAGSREKAIAEIKAAYPGVTVWEVT